MSGLFCFIYCSILPSNAPTKICILFPYLHCNVAACPASGPTETIWSSFDLSSSRWQLASADLLKILYFYCFIACVYSPECGHMTSIMTICLSASISVLWLFVWWSEEIHFCCPSSELNVFTLGSIYFMNNFIPLYFYVLFFFLIIILSLLSGAVSIFTLSYVPEVQ